MNDIASKYTWGTHKATGLSCIVLTNSNALRDQDPDFVKWFLNQCENVQDNVWKKKFDTYHNTLAQGYVVAYMDAGSIVGFMSGSTFAIDDKNVGFYFSDGMILPRYRGMGLANLSYALIKDQ
jgi:hypothetical protein